MSTVQISVQDRIFEFSEPPRGKNGVLRVREGLGPWRELTWEKKDSGLSFCTPTGSFEFDIFSALDDEGQKNFDLFQRDSDLEWHEIKVNRAGIKLPDLAGSGKKKNLKIKSQMPGKIVKILCSVGDEIKKDQPLLVMEAMKMENEIRASQAGKIFQLKVSVGQAVETGAELITLE